MCVMLGGHIATGAQGDLRKVTRDAHAQVMQYGRSDRLGHVSFKHPQQDALPADKPYSKATAEVVDAEGRSLINCSYERALGQLMRHCDRVEQVREQGWGGQGLCCLRSSQGVCSDSEGLKGWEHS
ncbi:hypothetical protein Y1Q_0017325 [Alligator mississippiensis]|uniref:Peptidase M41 domain-containing protein n=1 Tax=Alligator mississippiensis TaxID=8496 RepID=A0A151N8D1_ALLMI|nr:hypothetical protein Y1Q_0017325 [Alligator mississippiensis]